MPGKDLGNKHSCWKCGTKFYDLRKPAPLCPKCGADARENPGLRAPASERKARPPREPVREEVELPDIPVEKEIDEEGDDVLEDVDDED